MRENSGTSFNDRVICGFEAARERLRNSSASRSTPALSGEDRSRGTGDNGEQRHAQTEARDQQSFQKYTGNDNVGSKTAKGKDLWLDQEKEEFPPLVNLTAGKKQVTKAAGVSLEQFNRYQELEVTEETNGGVNETEANQAIVPTQPEASQVAGQAVITGIILTSQEKDTINDSQETTDENKEITGVEVAIHVHTEYKAEKIYLEENLEHTYHLEPVDPVGPLEYFLPYVL
ncbi:hypothetical protein R1sor_009634 [Riccia sorocarpa]|uniref:Uncharacterized protein n=1 Tax=Riccia sorocarpa TaxID=122646 RepID=A0ABD3HVX4_9MARC